VESNVEDLYPDPMAQYVAQQLTADARAVEKNFAVYVP